MLAKSSDVSIRLSRAATWFAEAWDAGALGWRQANREGATGRRMEEAKKAQAGRLAKLGGLEESLSTQDTITDAPAQSAVDILVRARSAEAAGDKKEGHIRFSKSTARQHGSSEQRRRQQSESHRPLVDGRHDRLRVPGPLAPAECVFAAHTHDILLRCQPHEGSQQIEQPFGERSSDRDGPGERFSMRQCHRRPGRGGGPFFFGSSG